MAQAPSAGPPLAAVLTSSTGSASAGIHKAMIQAFGRHVFDRGISGCPDRLSAPTGRMIERDNADAWRLEAIPSVPFIPRDHTVRPAPATINKR